MLENDLIALYDKNFTFMTIFIMSFSHKCLNNHLQALVVTTPDWNSIEGTARLFERSDELVPWKLVHDPIQVVVGKSGLAWGIGLHPPQNHPAVKREGDGKSPAGIFSIGPAFGFAHSTNVQLDYLPLTSTTEAVDDPASIYYNQIVDTKEISPDWKSSEKMSSTPLYRVGFVINHNFPHPKPHAGSAIFFHLWRSSHSGTAGCTATSYDHLSTILSWLDKTKKPVLVQLPLPTYRELQTSWNLPA